MSVDVSQYEVLVGVEEEFLILHKDGTLVNAADELMHEAYKLLRQNKNLLDNLRLKIQALDPEPARSQIEYVTLPLPPQNLHEAIYAGRKLLTEAAKQLNLKLLAQSMHPIQSNPHPICGMHINVSIKPKGGFMTVDMIAAVYNYLWNYLPELWALSANSPCYLGKATDIKSNRFMNSGVLKPNDPAQILVPREAQAALIPIHNYYGNDRLSLRIGAFESKRRVITNRDGNRLVDIAPRGPYTNITEDKDESPLRNRVEIRIFDIQQKVGDIQNLAFICALSAVHAISIKNRTKIDKYHSENIQRALLMGLKGNIIKNGTEIKISKSISSWLKEIIPYQQMLGIKINTNLIKEKVALPPQKDLPLIFTTEEYELLRQNDKRYVIVEFGDQLEVRDSSGRRYRIRKGSQVQGVMGVQYSLSYNEDIPNIVTKFNAITITNVIDVQGLNIPLTSRDRIVLALSEHELRMRRLSYSPLF